MSRLRAPFLVAALIVSGLLCPVAATEAAHGGCDDEANTCTACSDWMACACCTASGMSSEPDPPVRFAERAAPPLPAAVASGLPSGMDVFHPPRP